MFHNVWIVPLVGYGLCSFVNIWIMRSPPDDLLGLRLLKLPWLRMEFLLRSYSLEPGDRQENSQEDKEENHAKLYMAISGLWRGGIWKVLDGSHLLHVVFNLGTTKPQKSSFTHSSLFVLISVVPIYIPLVSLLQGTWYIPLLRIFQRFF